jgi:hypothetical protein
VKFGKLVARWPQKDALQEEVPQEPYLDSYGADSSHRLCMQSFHSLLVVDLQDNTVLSEASDSRPEDMLKGQFHGWSVTRGMTNHFM